VSTRGFYGTSEFVLEYLYLSVGTWELKLECVCSWGLVLECVCSWGYALGSLYVGFATECSSLSI